jgi:hypothetical protein
MKAEPSIASNKAKRVVKIKDLMVDDMDVRVVKSNDKKDNRKSKNGMWGGVGNSADMLRHQNGWIKTTTTGDGCNLQSSPTA